MNNQLEVSKESPIGVYSALADMRYGHAVWKDINGTEILVTCVFPNINAVNTYMWDDKKIVSKHLSHYVCACWINH